jgi:DNA polymerase-3 subunit gamma/tau
MNYQVLARKWRPQHFSELIGQEPIVTALENALRDGRIAQAYLFSGIRGVGKTTAARLLAKSLNQIEETSSEILSGGDMDVIEVDAATYSKVEQVRELTESLQYKPAGRQYKVVIIDEIHRLSRQAFDALLKIVEEPPDHLVFIFATTEIEAVPATLLSRCQEFHFRRVPAEVLVQHLKKLADAESIETSDTALRLIARAGEGSVRDSVALLDQLATFGSGKISDEDAIRLLGGLDTKLFERLLSAITGGQPAIVTQVVSEIEENGWDPRHAFTQFLSYCRDALHAAVGADGAQIDLPRDEVERLRKSATEVGYENLLRLLNLLLQSEQVVRRSESAGLAVEIAWLRAAELPKLIQIERALARSGPSGGAAKASGRARSSSGSPPSSSAKRSDGAEAGASRPLTRTTRAKQDAADKGTSKAPAAEPRSANGLKASATALLPNEALERSSDLAKVSIAEVEEHPVVQAVLDVFGGSIQSVEAAPRPEPPTAPGPDVAEEPQPPLEG